MGFLDDLKKKFLMGVTGNSYVKSNEKQVEQNTKPLVKKAVQRVNTQRQAGTLPTNNVQGRGVLRPEVAQQQAYQSRMRSILGTAPDTRYQDIGGGRYRDTTSRGTVGQITQPLIGSASKLIASVPGNVATLAGNAIQDPLGSALRGVEAVNPINYSIKAFNAVSPWDAPNPFQWRENAVANAGTAVGNRITPQSVQNVQQPVGQSFEGFGKAYTDNVDRIVTGSGFDPNARPGENRLITNLSSGAGSLGASLALSRLPGGTMLPSTIFGINSAGEQTRAARDAGKSNSEALNIGVQAGAAEAALEKFGLDKYLGNFGGSNRLINTAKNAFTEGTQEGMQSLAQSGISSQYQDVNWKDAITQAGQEAALGTILGGGSTAIVGGAQNLEGDIQKVKDTYKSTAPQQTQLSDNELYTLTDYAEALNGTNKQEGDGMRRNQVTTLARQIGDKIGLDVIKGSPVEIQKRIAEFVDGQLAMRSGQAGFISADPNESETVRLAKTAAKLAKGVDPQTPQGKATLPLSQTKKLDQKSQQVQEDPVANALGITENLAGEQISDLEKSVESISSTDIIPQFTNQEASRPQDAEDFGAVATNPNSRNSKKLEQAVISDDKITEAARKAQLEGTEFNYYAEKGEGGRSVAIKAFDPKNHRIESGLVKDQNNKVLGNHIKVDPSGVEVNVGGESINMSDIIGDIGDIKNSNRIDQTMERNIFRVFKDKIKARKVYDFVIGNKLDNERTFRTELKSERDKLGSRTKEVMRARPWNVNKKSYKESIFDYIEGNKTKKELTNEYGKETVAKIDNYKKETRKLYDSLLERVNETFARFGEPTVAKRKDYLTHINELRNKPNFAGEMFGRLRNSALGEADGKTRSGVPAEISGRTGDFEPRKRWNPFFQERKGSDNFKKDPFEAVDAYIEPSLYNIHMTETAVRARAVETAIRTANKFENEFDPKTVKKGMEKEFSEKFKDTNVDKVVNAWQEYANALAGKTNALDRWATDKGGDTAEPILRGWQGLQRIGGRATILGNAQSVLSQTLGIPSTIADAGAFNTIKALKNNVLNDKAIEKSRFVQSRITNVQSPISSNATKALDALGMPLQVVEQEFVKLTWYAEYEAAKQKGFKGDNAIREADRLTERVVAGRGIADKPEIYRSTIANGFLQYTLEVNAQNQKFWKDFNTTQKVKYMTGAFVMNAIMGALTGFEPLPDFIGAAIDTVEDFADDDDEERGLTNKAGAAAQNFASEAVNMNPFLMAAANALPQTTRKTVFGQDSDVGRFDGQAAPIKVIERGISGGKNLIEGNYGNAASEITRGFVPAGNQINKTVSGAATLNRGYAVDGGGNPTYAAPTDPAGKAKTLVFGSNSTKEARNYYDNKQPEITGKEDLAKIASSSNKAETVKGIQDTKQANKEAKKTGVTASNNSGNSWDDLIARYDNEEDKKNMSDTEKTIAETVKELPKGLDQKSKEILVRDARLTSERKKKYSLDEELDVMKAEYARDTEKGTLSKGQQFDKEKDIAKMTIAKDYGKDTKDLYGLALYELESISMSEEEQQKLLDYDLKLYDAGLISKPKFKSNYYKGSKKYGTKSGSGSKKKSFTIPAGFSLLPSGGASSAGSINKLLTSSRVDYKA